MYLCLNIECPDRHIPFEADLHFHLCPNCGKEAEKIRFITYDTEHHRVAFSEEFWNGN